MAAVAGSEYPHLSKAPIVEALLDFRVRLPAGFEVSRFKELQGQLSGKYPIVQEHQQTQEQIKNIPGRSAEFAVRDDGVVGYRFLSADQKNIAQFRRDGFTFSRLEPYTSWDEIFPEASRLWLLYVSAAEQVEVSRIAVRYINRLKLPLPDPRFEEYLTAAPAPPPTAPQNVSSFLSRIVLHEPETGLAATVVQALEPPLKGAYVTMILDIDVYEQDVSESSAQAVPERFSKLRQMKNRIFFGSVTHKMLSTLL